VLSAKKKIQHQQQQNRKHTLDYIQTPTEVAAP
jgi:hypothetical protein